VLGQDADNFEIVIVEKTRISKIQFILDVDTWTDDDLQTGKKKSEDLDQTYQCLAHCLNEGKCLKDIDADVQIKNKPIAIDFIRVNEPLLTVYVFYRYYVHQLKYKAVVKQIKEHQPLQHPKYIERRDQLAEFADEEANKDYIRLMLIKFIM
jgi:hypothetical protein